MSVFTIERDVCFMKCEKGLLPQFELYDIDEDGARNYIIRPSWYSEDPDKPQTITALEAQLKRYQAESIHEYLSRQIEWSLKTFGDGKRTRGITAHIAKELEEIRQDPSDRHEWIDVIILAMDGYWRSGEAAADLLADLQAKQTKNFAREWPTPTAEDIPVEHKGGHADELKRYREALEQYADRNHWGDYGKGYSDQWQPSEVGYELAERALKEQK